jgi:hypothetical protein
MTNDTQNTEGELDAILNEAVLPKRKEAVKALIATAHRKGEQNGVAWAIGVIDDLHFKADIGHDYEYKGIKNTIRDRFKATTGIDPAPSYPVKAELKSSTEAE